MYRLFILLIFLSLTLTAEAPTLTAPEHLFAETYNRWINLRAATELAPGTISAKELKAWQEVKASWKALAHYEDGVIY